MSKLTQVVHFSGGDRIKWERGNALVILPLCQASIGANEMHGDRCGPEWTKQFQLTDANQHFGSDCAFLMETNEEKDQRNSV